MYKKWLFTYFNLLFLCMWLQVINKVKVTHQIQGHASRSSVAMSKALAKFGYVHLVLRWYKVIEIPEFTF